MHLNVIKEGFKEYYIKILEGLSLNIDGSEINIFVEFHSRQKNEEILEFFRRLEVVDSHVIFSKAIV